MILEVWLIKMCKKSNTFRDRKRINWLYFAQGIANENFVPDGYWLDVDQKHTDNIFPTVLGGFYEKQM